MPSQLRQLSQDASGLSPQRVVPRPQILNVCGVDVACLIGTAGNLVDVIRRVLEQTDHLTDTGEVELDHMPVYGHFKQKGSHVFDTCLRHAPLNHFFFLNCDTKRDVDIPFPFCLLALYANHPPKIMNEGARAGSGNRALALTLQRPMIRWPVPIWRARRVTVRAVGTQTVKDGWFFTFGAGGGSRRV